MKTVKRLLVINLFWLFIITTTNSQPGPGIGIHRQTDQINQRMHNIESIYNRIPDLTDDQKAKIKTFTNDFLQESKILKADLAIKRAELQKLELSNQPDQAAINKKIDEIGELRTKLDKKRSEFRQKVRSILTDEQKAYFDNFCFNKRNRKPFDQQHFRRNW